jgi:hypothetical protein
MGTFAIIDIIIIYFIINFLCYCYHRIFFRSVYSILPDRIIMTIEMMLVGIFFMMFIWICEFIYRGQYL